MMVLGVLGKKASDIQRNVVSRLGDWIEKSSCVKRIKSVVNCDVPEKPSYFLK